MNKANAREKIPSVDKAVVIDLNNNLPNDGVEDEINSNMEMSDNSCENDSGENILYLHMRDENNGEIKYMTEDGEDNKCNIGNMKDNIESSLIKRVTESDKVKKTLTIKMPDMFDENNNEENEIDLNKEANDGDIVSKRKVFSVFDFRKTIDQRTEQTSTKMKSPDFLHGRKDSKQMQTDKDQGYQVKFRNDSHQRASGAFVWGRTSLKDLQICMSDISEDQGTFKATTENENQTATERAKTEMRHQVGSPYTNVKIEQLETNERSLNVQKKHSKNTDAKSVKMKIKDLQTTQNKNLGMKIKQIQSKGLLVKTKQNKDTCKENVEKSPKSKKWDKETTSSWKDKMLQVKFKCDIDDIDQENLMENGIRINEVGIGDNKHLEGKKIMTFAEDGTNTCVFCPYNSKCKDFVWRHWGCMHKKNVNSYYCSYCGSSYSGLHNIKRHIRSKHKVKDGDFDTIATSKKFLCNICFTVVSTQRNLERHRLNVHNYAPKKYNCSNCEFTTERGSSLNRHQKMVHNTVYYCCEKCVAPFETLADYKAHMCSMPGLQIKCHLCEKTFSSIKCIQTHIKSHSNQWQHICDKCGRKFAKISHLSRHHNIKHEKEVIRYNCRDCFASFLYISSLQKHRKVAHLALTNSERKQYLKNRLMAGSMYQSANRVRDIKCPKCSCVFYFKSTLRNHMVKRHLCKPDPNDPLSDKKGTTQCSFLNT